MKFTWGHGIFLLLAVFLIGMITLVVISVSQEINLVSEDYYPKGINYQQQIDKEARTTKLDKGIEFTQDESNVYLKFPNLDSLSSVSGKVLMFYPRSYRFDKEYEIDLNDSLYQILSKDSIMTGKCIIKIDWSIDSVDYYQEETLMLR
jgi:hypothetical protein